MRFENIALLTTKGVGKGQILVANRINWKMQNWISVAQNQPEFDRSVTIITAYELIFSKISIGSSLYISQLKHM